MNFKQIRKEQDAQNKNLAVLLRSTADNTQLINQIAIITEYLISKDKSLSSTKEPVDIFKPVKGEA
jgi:hypothetical protein